METSKPWKDDNIRYIDSFVKTVLWFSMQESLIIIHCHVILSRYDNWYKTLPTIEYIYNSEEAHVILSRHDNWYKTLSTIEDIYNSEEALHK